MALTTAFISERAFAALIMDTSYGIRLSESNDPYIRTAEQAMDGLNEAAVPGAFLVDAIPALKYVPKWFPGAGWKLKAKKWNKLRKIFIEKPFEEVKSRMVSLVFVRVDYSDGLPI